MLLLFLFVSSELLELVKIKCVDFCCLSLFVICQAITILVKNVKSNNISEIQLQVLLGYAEEDIYDQSRQATAFGLLKVTSLSVCRALNLMLKINQRIIILKYHERVINF